MLLRASLFRIDKFEVPAPSRDAFLDRLMSTHAALDANDGCPQNHVLEQVSGPGRFNVVTFVEWADARAYEAARSAAEVRQRQTGFDRQAFLEQLGISPDLANYRIVPHK